MTGIEYNKEYGEGRYSFSYELNKETEKALCLTETAITHRRKGDRTEINSVWIPKSQIFHGERGIISSENWLMGEKFPRDIPEEIHPDDPAMREGEKGFYKNLASLWLARGDWKRYVSHK